jgi:hypothetical protein
MDKPKIIKHFPVNLSLHESIVEQEKARDKTKELTSIQCTSTLKQKIVSGAVTFLLLSSGSSAIGRQQKFIKIPSSVQMLSDFEARTDSFREIEQDVQMISTLQKSHIEKRIDGDEIQEEMDIISNYMSNVEKYYETRKKRFKI